MSETNLFFVAALLVASTALAAPGSEADVVQAVVEHNPTVRASVVDLQRTAETVRAEASRWRPRLVLDGTATQQATPNLNVQGGTTTQTSQALTFGAQLEQQFSFGTVLSLRLENKTSRLEGPLFSGSTDTYTLGPGYGFTARLGVTQPLLRGFGDDVGLAQLRSAQLDKRDQSRARDETASSTLSTALQAWWELWYAQRSLRIEQDSRALAQTQRDEAKRKVEAGSSAEVELLTFETRLAELDQAVLTAETTVRTRTLELNQALGLAGDAPVDLGDVGAPAVDRVSTDDAQARAEEASWAVLQAQLSLERAETTLRSAADATRARLDVSAWVQTQGLGNQSAAAGLEQLATFRNVSGNVGVTFELPLSGEQHDAQLGAARLAVSAARERLAAARDQVRTQAATEVTTLTRSRAQLTLAERTAEVSERSAAAQEKRLRSGAATPLEVREAQDSLRRARLSVERARVDAAKAQLRLEHLTGALLARWGVNVER